MKTITPNLWFDGNAKEAVDFYVSVFPGSKVGGIEHYPNSEDEGLADFQKGLAGKVLTVEFELAGHNFMAINAGPEFKFNPSVSFMVNFDPSKDTQAREHIDEVWAKLIKGGEALMPLQEYPFSKYYGWVKDQYGLTWQLMLTDPSGESRPCIIPSLMFTGKNTNHAEEAMKFYMSVFKDSKQGTVAPYGQDAGPAKAGSLMFADFTLEGQWFAVMDSGVEHKFTFNEAVSFSIPCEDQKEIDYYWEKLSAVPASEQCGWCKDKYGLSWQVVPKNTGELMKRPNAFANLMKMKKIIIADFQFSEKPF